MSEGSDLLILAVPSRSDMIRAAPGGMIGSGSVNSGASSVQKSLLNFCAMSRAKLEMLLLVLADRHVGRLVEQHVGRLQHRVGEQRDAGALAVLARLVLELASSG
jgi:hypothetical protein